MTRRFAHRVRDRVAEVLEAPPSDPFDREALAVAFAVIALTSGAHPFLPTASPVLEVVFRVQFRESGQTIEAGREVTTSADADQSLAELLDSDAFAAVARHPRILALTEREAEAAADRVEALIERDELPPFLTADEALLVVCYLLRALATRAEGDGSEPSVSLGDSLVEIGLVEHVVDRLQREALDGDAEERRVLLDVGLALAGGYVLPVVTPLCRVSYVARSDEEDGFLGAVYEASVVDAAILEPYARYLEAGGFESRWVRHLQSEVRDAPIVMRHTTAAEQLTLPLAARPRPPSPGVVR